jgi:predicted Zn-dependent protease
MRKLYVLGFAIFFLIISLGLIAAEKPEKITFIHYKDGKIKTIDPNAKPSQNTCYKLLGVKWNAFPVSYVINPSNNDGLSESFIADSIFASAEQWDAYTSKEIFNNVYSIDYSATFEDVSPDGKNEYVFSSYSQNNVIAITNVWGYFSGPKSSRRIVEYDVLFNEYYSWGDVTLNPDLMDLQNIATHETGHGIGLADLYNTCVQETMYGYSTEGETSKRSLNSGDIAGLKALYGA